LTQFLRFVATPFGAGVLLLVAAYLEVQGDACFQSALYHASGAKRAGWVVVGSMVLVSYSLLLNSSRIDFGRLLGIYVVLFFMVAQAIARVQFHQAPTKPIFFGGALIVAGGLVMTFWKP